MIPIFLVILTVLTIFNLICIVAISIFLVRHHQSMRLMFKDVVEAMGVILEPVSLEQSDKKTWDEKYEEEMAFRRKQVQVDSGLKDLNSDVD